MSRIGAYQPTKQYKNYLLPTSKPLRSHALYKEKVWSLQEQIYQKLKKVAQFLEGLYPKLTDDFSKNVKVVIERNLEILMDDLDLMQNSLNEDPHSFNTNKLKTNQHCITEMKDVCNTLQSVRSYEYESKLLGKIKHELHELENLIQPTSYEKSLEKARVKNKPKTVPTKKERIKGKTTATVKSQKQKAISKKAKPTTKLVKPIKKANKPLKKSEKKATKSKPKGSAKRKKVLLAKSKSKR